MNLTYSVSAVLTSFRMMPRDCSAHYAVLPFSSAKRMSMKGRPARGARPNHPLALERSMQQMNPTKLVGVVGLGPMYRLNNPRGRDHHRSVTSLALFHELRVLSCTTRAGRLNSGYSSPALPAAQLALSVPGPSDPPPTNHNECHPQETHTVVWTLRHSPSYGSLPPDSYGLGLVLIQLSRLNLPLPR
jgi:hypothetical protein